MSNNNQESLDGLGDANFPESPTELEQLRLENERRNRSRISSGVTTTGFPQFGNMPPQGFRSGPVNLPPQMGQPGQLNTTTSAIAPLYNVSLAPYTPEFNIVDINPETVGRLLTGFCHRGSKLVGVDVNNINCTVTELPPAGADINLDWCVRHGMVYFDAVIWLTADPAIRPRLTLATNVGSVPIYSNIEISKAIFYVYFFLLTQAKYPTQMAEGQQVPAFLRTILGLTEPPITYVRKICTFNIQLFDPTWIKYVQFNGFGQETLSRFGLGVAGYRLFAPFGLLQCRADANPEARNAYTFARLIAMNPPTWNVHPVTRSPNLLAQRGNLNKNLANLMLECFTPADLQMMVNNKQLFNIPIRQIGYENWRTWSAEPGEALQNPIFPRQ